MNKTIFFACLFISGLVVSVAQNDINSLLVRGINPSTGKPFSTAEKQLKSSDEPFLKGAVRYDVTTVVPTMPSLMCFDIFEDKFYVNTNEAVIIYDINSEEQIAFYPKTFGYDAYPSFLTLSPDGQKIWLGYTQGYNVDDRIYSINPTTGVWNLEANFPANFDLEFAGNRIFVSGVDMVSQPNVPAIFLFDTSGNNNHKKIIELIGNAAGLSIDNDGNIYFGTSFYYGDNYLYKWNNSDIENIIIKNDGTFLTVADAIKLSDLSGGAYDCCNDDAGNLLFTTNGASKELCVWNGIEGDGYNFYVLGSSDDPYCWLTMVKAKGVIFDHDEGNGVYTFSYAEPVNRISKRSPYIAEVLEYTPAPGQFINESPWGLPESLNTITGKMGTTSGVSLGAFGGYLVFKFDGAVENHPDNPYGIDFYIYGNALEVEGIISWAEPGTVWVMKDENGNGLPDDNWYLLAGSDYWFSSTKKDYQVTYTNPNAAVDVPWYDNYGNSDFIYVNNSHTQPYYPSAANFPNINQNSYTLSGVHIDGNIYPFQGDIISRNRAFGFADNTPYSPALPLQAYNPYDRNNNFFNGDGFDISWAVNENGDYVDLDMIHFVKVQTAILADGYGNGEISTEVMGALVIDPNPSAQGVLDMVVIKDIPREITTPSYQMEVFTFNKGIKNSKNIVWTTDNAGATVDNNNVLRLSSGNLGNITITASLSENPDIKDVVTTRIRFSSINENYADNISIYPNPASDFILIKGIENATVKVYNMTGKIIMEHHNCNENSKIEIDNLSQGIYLISIEENGIIAMKKLVVGG